MLVHKWRSEEAGIMAGVNTILTDNPRLDVRDWTGKNPVRIIIDRNNRIGRFFNVKDSSRPTLVFTSEAGEDAPNLEYINPSNDFRLGNILRNIAERWDLFRHGRGWRLLLNSFINANLWDEARVFTGKTNFRRVSGRPIIRREPDEVSCSGIIS